MATCMIAPSLLSANFANLQADLEMINRSEADWLHTQHLFRFPCIETCRPTMHKTA